MSQGDSILDAARRLARAGGALRMSDVAAEAGVSRATLYRSYRSRRVLLAALRRGGLPVQQVPDPQARALGAVERLLLRDGFGALTMEGVAAEAGLSLRTVYRAFGDRVGLLRAFAQRRSGRAAIRAHLETPVASAEEIERALLAFTEALLEALEAGKALFLLALAAPAEIREALRGLRDSRRGLVSALAAFLQAQMDAGRLRAGDARTLAAIYNGQLLAAAVLLPELGESMPPRAQLGRTLAGTLLRGLLL